MKEGVRWGETESGWCVQLCMDKDEDNGDRGCCGVLEGRGGY